MRCASQPSASCDRRDVDRNLDRRVPLRRFGAVRSRDDLLRQPADQADFLGDGNEHVRADHAAQRVDPAGEHFETDDFAGCAGRPAVRNRARTGRDRAPKRMPCSISLWAMSARSMPASNQIGPRRAAALGMVHARYRRAGAGQEFGPPLPAPRAIPAKAPDLDHPLVDRKGVESRRAARLRRIRSARAISLGASASAIANSSPLKRARSQCRGPARRSSDDGNRPQQLVADVITVAVVDRLESVNLDRKDRRDCRPIGGRGAAAASPLSAKPLRLSRPVMRVGRREHGRAPLRPRRAVRLRAAGRRSAASRTGSARR